MHLEKALFDLSLLLTQDNQIILHLRTLGVIINFLQRMLPACSLIPACTAWHPSCARATTTASHAAVTVSFNAPPALTSWLGVVWLLQSTRWPRSIPSAGSPPP